MLQKVTRLDSVPTAEETVLTTEVPTKESRLYTLLHNFHFVPLYPWNINVPFLLFPLPRTTSVSDTQIQESSSGCVCGAGGGGV